MMNRFLLPLLTVTGLATAFPVLAAANYPPTNQVTLPAVDPFTLRCLPTPGLHFMAQGGISLGGTKMASLKYNDGYYGSGESTIHAGALANIGLGAVLQFVDSPISLSIAANYARDQASARDADLSFSRVPLDFMVHTQMQRNRFGIGFTQHSNIDYEATQYNVTTGLYNSSSTDSVLYKDATGVIAEWSYLMGGNMWFATRYTNITYKPDTLNGAPITGAPNVNGSNIAFMIRGIF